MNSNMTPIDWAKRPLQKYATFAGRAPRAEYWWFTLGMVVASIIAMIIDSILGFGTPTLPYGPFYIILMLALLIPGIAVTVRRLHDTNRRGWWILLPVIPYALLIVVAGGAIASGNMAAAGAAGLLGLVALGCAVALLVFMVLPGTRGENRFGPDPYAGEGAMAAAA